jgi:hypothetical protein
MAVSLVHRIGGIARTLRSCRSIGLRRVRWF